MDRTIQGLLDREQHERDCPNCGSNVWVLWNHEPNVKCDKCQFEGNVKQCETCTNLLPDISEHIMCDLCLENRLGI